MLYAPPRSIATSTLGGPGVIEVDDLANATGTFTDAASGLIAGTGAGPFVVFATNSEGTYLLLRLHLHHARIANSEQSD